jgi:prepilin-type N-terminal cleavage/methylation domain-containing protein
MFARRRTKTRILRRQRGMTLLEIMIVLAILGLVMAFLVGPKVMKMFQEGKEDIARMTVKQLASEAYPRWSARATGKQCPSSLSELTEYSNNATTKDQWGTEMQMICRDSLPASAQKNGIGIVSAGPNGKMGDNDDIKSWDE